MHCFLSTTSREHLKNSPGTPLNACPMEHTQRITELLAHMEAVQVRSNTNPPPTCISTVIPFHFICVLMLLCVCVYVCPRVYLCRVCVCVCVNVCV